MSASVPENNLYNPFANTKRHFSPDAKLTIVKEALGSTVHGTALRHELAPSMLFRWRKQYRQAMEAAPEAVGN